MKLSVIVPAYNEEATLPVVLDTVIGADLGSAISREIVVVDDASTDGTWKALTALKERNASTHIVLLRHEVNRGKGAAFRTALAHCTGDWVVMQDADLEYDPADLALLLHPVLRGEADVVYGSRFLGGRPPGMFFSWHFAGNRFLTFLSNVCTGLELTDMETCYKLMRADTVRALTLREDRFGIEPELTAKLSRAPDVRFREVGISYQRRTYADGKKITWRDGFRAIACIMKYGLFRID